MYKKGIWVVLGVLACAVYAQGKENLEQADILAAFEQYNPAALEKASADETYGNILHKLAAAYKVQDTLENQAEMIALVKNFDNSLQLHAINQAYRQGRTLQLTSGASLDSLNTDTEQAIKTVLQDVYRNTLDVKKIQIGWYKQQVKAVKANKELSAEQQKEQISQWKEKIKKTQQEVRSLKKNAAAQISQTAKQYFADMQADYEQAQAKELRALQSKTHNVKANHKKPVAK